MNKKIIIFLAVIVIAIVVVWVIASQSTALKTGLDNSIIIFAPEK